MRGNGLREDTRDVILDVAEVLMRRYGYTKTTVGDIARAAGIGKGSIYLYFASKEEVALSYIDRMSSRLQDRLRDMAHSPGSVCERLRNMLVARVLYYVDSVSHVSQSLDELLAAIRPAILTQRETHFDAESRVIADVVEAGVASHEIQCDDTMATARAMVLATNSLMPYSLSVQELGDREAIRANADRIACLLLSGLRARS